MSGSEAFLSFSNWLKTSLTGSGLNVYTSEPMAEKTLPYIHLQELDEDPTGCISKQMCQLWLVVEEVLPDTLIGLSAKYKDLLRGLTFNPPHIEKYDYTKTPALLVGSVLVKLLGISGDLSDDGLRSKRVFTFELISNA